MKRRYVVEWKRSRAWYCRLIESRGTKVVGILCHGCVKTIIGTEEQVNALLLEKMWRKVRGSPYTDELVYVCPSCAAKERYSG